MREEEDAFREAVEVAILAVLRILDRVDVEQVLGRAHPSLPAFQATEVDTYLALDEVLSLRGVDNLFKGVIHTYVRTTSRSRPLRHTLEICSAVVRCGARLYPFLRPGLVSGILFSAVSEATNRGIGRAWMKDTLYLFVWALFCGDRAKLYTDDSLFSGYLDPSCYEVPSESSSGYETKRAFDLAVHTVCCFLRLDPLVMKDQRILVFLLAILQARMVLAQQRGIPVVGEHRTRCFRQYRDPGSAFLACGRNRRQTNTRKVSRSGTAVARRETISPAKLCRGGGRSQHGTDRYEAIPLAHSNIQRRAPCYRTGPSLVRS